PSPARRLWPPNVGQSHRPPYPVSKLTDACQSYYHVDGQSVGHLSASLRPAATSPSSTRLRTYSPMVRPAGLRVISSACSRVLTRRLIAWVSAAVEFFGLRVVIHPPKDGVRQRLDSFLTRRTGDQSAFLRQAAEVKRTLLVCIPYALRCVNIKFQRQQHLDLD